MNATIIISIIATLISGFALFISVRSHKFNVRNFELQRRKEVMPNIQRLTGTVYPDYKYYPDEECWHDEKNNFRVSIYNDEFWPKKKHESFSTAVRRMARKEKHNR